MTQELRAPFPWFGGKARVAEEVWSRFGLCNNYVEPFFGSGAVLLKRPPPFKTETINDLDHFVANFWRAMQSKPEDVASECDWPINECDLMARHKWLTTEGLDRIVKCEDDPDFFDVRTAAWWAWGLSQWIGAGWCSTDWKSRPALGPAMGVHKEGPHIKRPRLGGHAPVGVHRHGPHNKRPKLGGTGEVGVQRRIDLENWFQALSERLRKVRVCCGDWSRIISPTVTTSHGMTAMFLDPPYTEESGRRKGLYKKDSLAVGRAVAEWAFSQGRNPLMRIALCGYDGEYEVPGDWITYSWKSSGYSNLKEDQDEGDQNNLQERIWFSPNCLEPQPSLFKV